MEQRIMTNFLLVVSFLQLTAMKKGWRWGLQRSSHYPTVALEDAFRWVKTQQMSSWMSRNHKRVFNLWNNLSDRKFSKASLLHHNNHFTGQRWFSEIHPSGNSACRQLCGEKSSCKRCDNTTLLSELRSFVQRILENAWLMLKVKQSNRLTELSSKKCALSWITGFRVLPQCEL